MSVLYPASRFPCQDGDFIDADKRCNGMADCPDGSDEGVLAGCMFCSSGDVISESQVCDGPAHCEDGSDEEGCVTHNQLRDW